MHRKKKLTDGLTNLWGPINGEIKARLRAVLANPTSETWDDAQSIILNREKWLTLWQAILAVDPTFPRVGPRTDMKGNILEPWKRIPDALLIAKAIRHAKGAS